MKVYARSLRNQQVRQIGEVLAWLAAAVLSQGYGGFYNAANSPCIRPFPLLSARLRRAPRPQRGFGEGFHRGGEGFD